MLSPFPDFKNASRKEKPVYYALRNLCHFLLVFVKPRPPNLSIAWKIWVWWCLFPAPVFAQNDAPDPAILARLDALHETVRQNLLPIELPKISCENLKTGQAGTKPNLEQVKYYRENGAANCAFQLLEILKNESFSTKKGQLQWLEAATITLSRFEVLDSAIALATQFKELAETENYPKTGVLIAEANARSEKLQFWETFALAEKALENAREAGNKQLESDALETIADATRHIYQTLPKKSTPPLLEALKIQEELRDTNQVIHIFGRLAMHFYDTDLPKAVGFLERATALANRWSDLRAKMEVILMLSACYKVENEARKSLDLRLEAVEIAKYLGFRHRAEAMYVHCASQYLHFGDANAAQKNLDSALVYCSFQHGLGYLYSSLAEVAAARGDLKKSQEWYKKAFLEQTKAYANRNTLQLSEWETRFRTRETALQLEVQKQQRLLLFGLILAFAAFAAFAVFAYFKQRKSRKKLSVQNTLIQEQTEQLKSLDAAKSRFFANVSHELRTPLALMLGPVGTLLKENQVTDKQAHLLQLAHQSGKQLEQLVTDILDLGKLEMGKMDLDEKPTELATFFRRCLAQFESLADSRQIDFHFDIAVGNGTTANLDQAKCRQILNNLLSNAFKFTPPGGRVNVELRIENGEWRTENGGTAPASILHSPFSILHSQFYILHSSS